jgi:hypothetical protein
MQRLQGDGWTFVHAGGVLQERTLAAGELVRVDTGCIVALQPSVSYDIEFVGKIKTALFGGEGLFFATLRGPGKIWLQSLPLSRLANRSSRLLSCFAEAAKRLSIRGLGGLLDGDKARTSRKEGSDHPRLAIRMNRTSWIGRFVWMAVALAAAATATPEASRQSAPAGVGVLTRAHAHNDYEHQRPLFDALDHGFASVEADVWLVDGRLLVAHDREAVRADRTLETLYLDPLQARVRQYGGRVYPNGPEFLLWIDIKSEAETTYAALQSALASYGEMLTVFHQNGGSEGRVWSYPAIVLARRWNGRRCGAPPMMAG